MKIPLLKCWKTKNITYAQGVTSFFFFLVLKRTVTGEHNDIMSDKKTRRFNYFVIPMAEG